MNRVTESNPKAWHGALIGPNWAQMPDFIARFAFLALFASVLTGPLDAQAQAWQPVTSHEQLTHIFSDTTFNATLKGGVRATANYS